MLFYVSVVIEFVVTGIFSKAQSMLLKLQREVSKLMWESNILLHKASCEDILHSFDIWYYWAYTKHMYLSE